jgi:hypothetical protein
MTDTEFDTKFDYYETVREELGLSAIWSIYEIENLSEPHPFKDAKIVSYKVYHGKEYQVEINGSTWAALFVAANADTVITHGLNRVPTGYILTMASAAMSLYDGSLPSDNASITLRSSAVGSATIFLF